VLLIKAILGALLMLVALGGFAAPKEELKELRERIEELKKELAEQEETKAEVSDALKDSEQAISASNRSLSELSQAQRRTKTELRNLLDRSAAVQASVKRRQGQLEKLLTARYIHSSQNSTALLLSGKDPSDISRLLHYYQYVARAHAEGIRELRGDLAELNGLTEQVRAKSDELKTVASKERQEKTQLEKERQNKQQVLSRIGDEIQKNRKEFNTLKRDEARLTKLIERLALMIKRKEEARRAALRAQALKRQAEAKRHKPAEKGEKPAVVARNDVLPDDDLDGLAFAKLRGRLRLPVRGELTNRFGSPRSDSGISWSGLFIRASEGQEVKAIAAGRLVFADWLRGFGNLAVIDHGNGYMSVYGNNEALLKQAGEMVQGGETVASVGNSGGNPESGLYFELRHRGKAFDPMAWIMR
jgi:murein hydrolase activator